jgi:putative transcriptional regulator
MSSPTRGFQMKSGYLDGQMLVAMPSMADPRFVRSVIFMCAHSKEGAMGIVVNRRSRRLRFSDLLVQLEVIKAEDRIELPPAADGLQVLRGGPVDRSRGFVLHSPDYGIKDSTMEIEPGVSLTATVDILRAIASGEGPKRAVLALGYAGWSGGQLENEIQRNDWLNCPADSSLIFDADHDAKYERALRKIGVDPRMLSGDAGHA